MVIAALSSAAALLLLVAGAAKLRTPGPAAGMLVGLSPRLRPLRRARAVTRAAALVELGAGLALLAGGGRIAAALLAVCYLALTAVAVRLVTAPQAAPCGCFGAADGNAGPAHVVLDVLALAIAVAAVIHPSAGVPALFDSGTVTGLVATLQSALLAALGYLSITALPALTAARRTVESR
jgi:hypothetical protein